MCNITRVGERKRDLEGWLQKGQHILGDSVDVKGYPVSRITEKTEKEGLGKKMTFYKTLGGGGGNGVKPWW